MIEELTVEENLRLATLWCLRKQERQAAIEEIFELFPRLRGFRQAAASTLSGGERQMLVAGTGPDLEAPAPAARRAEPGPGPDGHRAVDGAIRASRRRARTSRSSSSSRTPVAPLGVAPRRDPQPGPGGRLRRRRHRGRRRRPASPLPRVLMP